MSGYVYKFIDNKDNVLYIGMTMRNIDERMNEHFGKDGHLPKSCYNQVDKIYFQQYKSKDDVEKMEKFYIAYYYPKYNIRDKPLKKMNIKLPERFEAWQLYDERVVTDKSQEISLSNTFTLRNCLYKAICTGCEGVYLFTLYKLISLFL